MYKLPPLIALRMTRAAMLVYFESLVRFGPPKHSQILHQFLRFNYGKSTYLSICLHYHMCMGFYVTSRRYPSQPVFIHFASIVAYSVTESCQFIDLLIYLPCFLIHLIYVCEGHDGFIYLGFPATLCFSSFLWFSCLFRSPFSRLTVFFLAYHLSVYGRFMIKSTGFFICPLPLVLASVDTILFNSLYLSEFVLIV